MLKILINQIQQESKTNVLDEKIKKLKKEMYSLDRSVDKHTIDKMTLIDNINDIELFMEQTVGKILEIEENCKDLY